MSNKLYVGNLNYSVTEEELKNFFEERYQGVKEVKVIEGKGFGFVELATKEDAEDAKEKLNGFEFKGRKMRVDTAKPKTEKKPFRRERGFGRERKRRY